MEPAEDAMGKSLGRLSVHSVSRLIEEDKLRQQQQERRDSDSDDGHGQDGKAALPPRSKLSVHLADSNKMGYRSDKSIIHHIHLRPVRMLY